MKQFNFYAIFVAFLILVYSCEKKPLDVAKPPVEPEITDTIPSNSPGNESSAREVVEVGTGSGHVILSGKKNIIYNIKPGTYSGISIKNLNNVKILGANVVIQGGNLDMSEVDSVEVSGLSFQNHDQAAVYIHSRANNINLNNLSFKNISNYCIRFDIKKKFNGNPDSFSRNIYLEKIKGENIGQLFISYGEILSDGFYGLIRNFRLQNVTVRNSPELNGLTSLGLAEDYVLSNNVVDNVNASDNFPNGNNNHTAIFFARGNGKIYNNRITNHQGNAVRAWPLTITKPGLIEIYDNIVHNSTRYGAFELQVNELTKRMPGFKSADAKIYHNTVGKLNTGRPKFFEGRLLDLYQTYGEVEIYNNLSFEMFDNKLINNMSNPLETVISRNTNNVYFTNWWDAVNNLDDFQSKHGVGAR